jgi:hypothetical protein
VQIPTRQHFRGILIEPAQFRQLLRKGIQSPVLGPECVADAFGSYSQIAGFLTKAEKRRISRNRRVIADCVPYLSSCSRRLAMTLVISQSPPDPTGAPRRLKIACRCCVLPAGYAGATFSGGVCNFCRKFRKRSFLGERAFRRALPADKEQLVGVFVSGGKDSGAALASVIEAVGPERTVAITSDKGRLVHPLARRNLDNLQKNTGCGFVRVPDPDFYPRFLKNLSAFLEGPDPAMLRAVLCAGCRHAISLKLLAEVAKHGINTVVNAASYLELAPFKSALMRENGNGDETNGLLLGLMENEQYRHDGNLEVIVRDHGLCHEKQFHTSLGCTRVGDINYVHYFDYVENDPRRVRQEVQAKLEFELPDGEDWHYDCLVEPFKDFLYYGLLGYTETDFHLCEMIRYKVISRTEALEALDAKRDAIVANVDGVIELAEKLGCHRNVPWQLHDFARNSPYLEAC